MKKLIIGVLLLTASSAYAGPYIEVKNELKYTNKIHKSTITHFRGGYEFKNSTNSKFYGEAGYTTDGAGLELGYKVKVLDKFTFKGKWEGIDTSSFTHKLETEIRYSW